MPDRDQWKELAAEALQDAQQTADELQKRTLLAMALAYDKLARRAENAVNRSPIPDAD